MKSCFGLQTNGQHRWVFFDIKDAFDFNADSQGDAADRLVKKSKNSINIFRIKDLSEPYHLQVEDIKVPDGLSNPDFIQVKKIPDLNLYLIKLLMSKDGKLSGTICTYFPFLRTVCICTNDPKHHLDSKAGKKKSTDNRIPINWYTFCSTNCRDLNTFTSKLSALVFPSAAARSATFTICALAKVKAVAPAK